MKKLTLQTLTISNFKGLSFTLETHGKNVDVFGQNATGKTTLYDALCWLLFGKDSDFKTDFEIKTLHADGTCEHNLNHEVKGLFRWDGKIIELKKIYAEIWTKRRGSSSKEMTGHTTDHFIDAVPVNKKDFQAYIQEIATEEQFKLLTSPFYFAEKMKWQDRRALVMSLLPEISDDDIISSDPDLNRLKDILQGRKIENHKKVVAARRKELNDFLEKIPVRIDEVVKGMPDISGINHLAEIDKVNKWAVEL
jgi:DNA repair exonuclease SbcCD ATPase subunit